MPTVPPPSVNVIHLNSGSCRVPCITNSDFGKRTPFPLPNTGYNRITVVYDRVEHTVDGNQENRAKLVVVVAINNVVVMQECKRYEWDPCGEIRGDDQRYFPLQFLH